MSHIVPYIPTEPPSIHDDSFENESCSSDICEYNTEKCAIQQINIDTVISPPIDQNYFTNEISEIVSQSPAELRQHIDKVVEENNLNVDCTDSRIAGDINDDCISECSFEGQFDEYIDHITNKHDTDIIMDDELMTTDPINFNRQFNQFNEIENNNMEDFDCDFTDFGDFTQVKEQPIDYFKANISDESCTNETAEFADFTKQQSPNDTVDHDGDDDFDDFASFTGDNQCQISQQRVAPIDEDTVLSFREKLLEVIDKLALQSADADTMPREPPLSPAVSEHSARIWKELTNFDYSPAFVFHWVQSASYERLMASLGPAFRDLLAAHRASLPLYSVNLTPLEPLPASTESLGTALSTASSSLDLTVSAAGNAAAPSDRNACSEIDIKNLEDEFVFDAGATCVEPPPRMVQPPSSGVLRSLLRPLSLAGRAPLHAQAEAVLQELPDLAYMTSKVLMFPVLAACDLEDAL